jgi:hypothetical protein
VDEIRLTLPDDPRLFPVAHLVLAGIGSRLDLTVDGLDDLRLGVDSLLARTHRGAEITISVRIDGDRLLTEVGPLESMVLERELAAERAAGLSLGRILDTVVDGVHVRDEDGGAWVTLEKRVVR